VGLREGPKGFPSTFDADIVASAQEIDAMETRGSVVVIYPNYCKQGHADSEKCMKSSPNVLSCSESVATFM